jgi:hypothetical protein
MPTCTRDSLTQSNVGFGGQGFDRRQYFAAAIYFMVLELAAIGGTDYRDTMTSTLISDTSTLIGRMDDNQRQIALLNILYNNAVASGATTPSSLNEIQAATACCFQSETVPFEDIMLLLLCKLGVHKAYPQ